MIATGFLIRLVMDPKCDAYVRMYMYTDIDYWHLRVLERERDTYTLSVSGALRDETIFVVSV